MDHEKLGKFFLLLTMAVYGLLLLPYDNEISLIAVVMVSSFCLLFVVEGLKPLIAATSALIWLMPLVFGIDASGVTNALRALIPVLLLVYVTTINFRELNRRFVTGFLILNTFIVVRYIYLMIDEVLVTGGVFPNLFGGATRALINEPILIGYYVFGVWAIFYNEESKKLGPIVYFIKALAIVLLVLAVGFQVRFFIIAFAMVAFLRAGNIGKVIILGLTTATVLWSPKFNDVSLENGKINQFMEVIEQVGDSWFYGLNLGALRDDGFGGLVRFADTAPPMFYLYGGVVGLIWYCSLVGKFLFKYRAETIGQWVIFSLPFFHAQFIQSGFKMFGLITLPFFLMIQIQLSDKHELRQI